MEKKYLEENQNKDEILEKINLLLELHESQKEDILELRRETHELKQRINNTAKPSSKVSKNLKKAKLNKNKKITKKISKNFIFYAKQTLQPLEKIPPIIIKLVTFFLLAWITLNVTNYQIVLKSRKKKKSYQEKITDMFMKNEIAENRIKIGKQFEIMSHKFTELDSSLDRRMRRIYEDYHKLLRSLQKYDHFEEAEKILSRPTLNLFHEEIESSFFDENENFDERPKQQIKNRWVHSEKVSVDVLEFDSFGKGQIYYSYVAFANPKEYLLAKFKYGVKIVGGNATTTFRLSNRKQKKIPKFFQKKFTKIFYIKKLEKFFQNFFLTKKF